MSVSPARRAAFDILLRIETERAYSSALLQQFEDRLGDPDRGLCHQLVLGTLRRQLYLDRLISGLVSKKLDIEIRIAIRLGLYQLIELDRVPPHAAINESVELVVYAKRRSAKSFVNAVLRRFQRERPALQFTDEIDRISVETSHPKWLVERWIEQLGVEEAAALASANNTAPHIAFRTVRGIEARADWKMSRIATGAFVSERMTDDLRELQASGEAYFQDEASQLVALSIDVPVNGCFIDVCAAPGGKTGLVALRHPDASVVAGDLYSQRVTHLRNNLRTQGAEQSIVLRYDAERSLPFKDASFDAMLVDVPCTGTGTIRHNPEIRYFIEESDIAALASKQQAILGNASKLVKPGGTLIYSTCSLEREEGEGIAMQFLGPNVDFEKIRPNVPDRFITADGFARTWPHRDDADGFFIAAFRRREDS